MPYTSRELREVFHLLFLRRLLDLAQPALFALKGGVNLRLFFNSPRLSEDMDLDVLAGSVATLRKNGYRVLEDPAFTRSLAAFGIEDIQLGDPSRAKHTSTTQRFRARLVTAAGEALPTKVEFSRRAMQHGTPHTELLVTAPINPQIAGRYRQIAFVCQHYAGPAAVRQKVEALAGRATPQVRDVFDLYILWLGGHWPATQGDPLAGEDVRERALANLLAMTYANYEGQVLDFLEDAARDQYASEARWEQVVETVFELLSGHDPSRR